MFKLFFCFLFFLIWRMLDFCFTIVTNLVVSLQYIGKWCYFFFPARHSATKGVVIAMVCTFFDAFNVPVFWPILVMYFIMLFCITMKRQIKVRHCTHTDSTVTMPCCNNFSVDLSEYFQQAFLYPFDKLSALHILSSENVLLKVASV